MLGLDLSQNIMRGEADFQAEDWASIGAFGSLDARVAAELKRGLNLELGAQALVQLDASLRKFIAAEARGTANAAARVKAQIQVPLDLFDEAGAAIRLQAMAEAAVGITLGIGLNMADFIALAESDPRIRGVAARLLHVFLEELTIDGGVMGKAAVAAMAYASVAITGRLIPDATRLPGFTLAGEFGLGLKAGAGWRVFANCGVNDPRRLIRRSVDVVIDEVVREVMARTSDPNVRALLPSLRAPAKMALRTGFELGLALSENAGAFDPGAGEKLAQRCLQVLLEEAQRFLLEQLGNLGLALFKEALAAMGVSRAVWHGARPQRERFAMLLRQMPNDPFELNDRNRSYWASLVGTATDLALQLGGQAVATAAWVEPVATFWAATQLLFVSVQRISQAAARASMIGLPPAQAHASFSGDLLPGTTPPDVVRHYINAALSRGATAQLKQEHLVEFLVRDAILNRLRSEFPAVEPVLNLLAGPQSVGAVAAAPTLLRNIGAFVPDTHGNMDS